MNWYSLRVMSGKENKVKDSIFRELGFEKDLESNVEEILIPTENIVDIKNGKKTDNLKLIGARDYERGLSINLDSFKGF